MRVMRKDDFDWKTLFAPGESPYFSMFRCGAIGIPVDQCIDHCEQLGIPLREKDIQSWKEGDWNKRIRRPTSVLNPLMKPNHQLTIAVTEARLIDYEEWPSGWSGSDRRWFPCDAQNMPMQKWGYSPGFIPTLYEHDQAQALSPIGWVGQNLYAQPFIVVDIDGVGHGTTDPQVIEFGNRYRDFTETWENPDKPGSFHLYFNTTRQIPISHFPYAKLDLMGNQKNAAVYLKDKQSNGVPRATLNDEFWDDLKRYLAGRLEQRNQEMKERLEAL